MALRSARRRLLAGTALALAGVLLAGCTHANTAGGTAPSSDTGAPIDHINVALPGSLSNLYPGNEAGILNYYVASATSEGLVHLDDQGKVQPSLAQSWTTPNPTTYVFELRPNAKFQDGSPVTPADVVASVQYAENPKTAPNLSYYAAGIKDVKATGAHEVTIDLKSPDASFLANLGTTGFLYVSSKKYLAAHADDLGTPKGLMMGTGPYKVTSFVPDQKVELTRVNTWWGGVPKVKDVTIDFVTDDNARLLAAKSGDFDLAFNVPLAQASQWESLQNMRVQYANDLSYVGLLFDTTVKPFDDPNVRKAIGYAIDRQAIVDKLLKGHAEVATGLPTPESLEGSYTHDEAEKLLDGLPQYDYDLDKAKQALAASSAPNGFTTELTYPNTGPQIGDAAQAISQSLAQIGVTVKVKEVPIEQWLANVPDPKKDHGMNFMWYFSTTGDPAEVSSYLIGAGNPSHFDNAQATKLLKDQVAETDPKKRIDEILQANKISAEQAVNLPLWWGQAATAFKSDLGVNAFSPFTFTQPWPANLFRAAQ